jgi:PAS domain S-box-containing protein
MIRKTDTEKKVAKGLSRPPNGNTFVPIVGFESMDSTTFSTLEQLLTIPQPGFCSFLIKTAPTIDELRQLREKIKLCKNSFFLVEANEAQKIRPFCIYYPPDNFLCEYSEGKIKLNPVIEIPDSTQLSKVSLEDQNKNLFELNPYPKWVYEKGSLKILDVNLAAMDLYGYTKEEFKRLTLKDLRPTSDWHELEKLQREVDKNKGFIHFGVINHLTKSGKNLYMDLHGHPINFMNKACVIATGQDVTQRELAFLALKDKEEKLENAQKVAKLGNWEYFLNNNNLFWSENMLNLWGLKSGTKHPSLGYFFKTVHPEDRKKLLLQVTKKSQIKASFKVEFRVFTLSGKVKWINLIGALKKGKDNVWQGTVQDISDQKNELHRLHLMERVITHNADGVMITEAEPMDKPGPQILYVNDAMSHLTGYSKEELIGENPRILQGPKTDKGALKQLRAAMKSWQPHETTVINYRKNGEEFYNHFSINPVADEMGWFTHWIAIERDVTKQKMGELQKELVASINKISQEIPRTKEFMEATLSRMVSFGEFDLAEFWIYEENSEAFVLQSQINTGLKSIHFQGSTYANHQGLYSEILQSKTSKIWNINPENKKFFEGYRLSPKSCLLGVPLISHHKVLGLLVMSNNVNKGTLFSMELQQAFLKELGHHIGHELERKILEESLKVSNERYEKLTEAANDAIYDWDLNTNEVYLGKGFETLFGYDLMIPYSFDDWMERVHDDDRQNLMHSIEEILENKTDSDTYTNEYRYKTAANNFATVVDRGMVIRNEFGSPIRLLGAIQDISYRKEHEESLKILNRKLTQRALELSRSNAELEQFAYVASHDLQEPLRMINSFLKLLEKRYGDKLDTKALEYIAFAVDGASRMRKILLDLLEFSKAGEHEDGKEKLSLNEVIEEACLLLKRKVQETKAMVKVENLPEIWGYRSRLVQVFFNLISNAIKYAETNQTPKIYITSKTLINFIEIHVQDNGIGIDPEYKDKIFEVFQRLHGKNEYEGTGMGLAIVKKIVESHGGSIELMPHPGTGAYFVLKLPENGNRMDENTEYS